MSERNGYQHKDVHCHIGSLEKLDGGLLCGELVHCHIGSLEIPQSFSVLRGYVHCHIGSLEKPGRD